MVVGGGRVGFSSGFGVVGGGLILALAEAFAAVSGC